MLCKVRVQKKVGSGMMHRMFGWAKIEMVHRGSKIKLYLARWKQKKVKIRYF